MRGKVQSLLVLGQRVIPFDAGEGAQIDQDVVQTRPAYFREPIVSERVRHVQGVAQPPLRQGSVTKVHPHPDVLVPLPPPELEPIEVAERHGGHEVARAGEARVAELAATFQVLVGAEERGGPGAGGGEGVNLHLSDVGKLFRSGRVKACEKKSKRNELQVDTEMS